MRTYKGCLNSLYLKINIMKAFIDISSDKIAISTPDGTVFLDRN
jgi:hypothetical protein